MKRLFTIVACFIFTGFVAHAQTATQTVNLTLADAIDIVFVNSGSATGATVTLPFSSAADYSNGVESAAQDLRVRSNKNFNVTVRTNAANFTYSGAVTPAPTMPISGILQIAVSANGTGGSIAGSFSGYSTLTSSNQSLIAGGTRGSNQTFSVKYKGSPGFAYPSGEYSVNVIYTVTQQ